MIKKAAGSLNPEERILADCKKNNRRAQLQLYNQYAKAMYTICLNIVHNRELAEDLMQEAFISAFKNLDKFKAEVTFGAWLKKISVNKCLDFLKKRKVNFVSLDNIPELEEKNNENNPNFSRYNPETIRKTISELPDGYRTIVSLYALEGYDHDEIGQILNISASTSRSQYTRAKALLAKRLKQL